MPVARSIARCNGLALVAGGLLAAATGCETESKITFQDNGIPRHEHGWQDWWNYQFVYYPEENVYYEPFTETYFWFDSDGWAQGDTLPRALYLDRTRAEVVRLQSDELPFIQQVSVSTWHEPVEAVMPEWHDARGDGFTMEEPLAARYEELFPEPEPMPEPAPESMLVEAEEDGFPYADPLEGLPLWLRMTFESITSPVPGQPYAWETPAEGQWPSEENDAGEDAMVTVPTDREDG